MLTAASPLITLTTHLYCPPSDVRSGLNSSIELYCELLLTVTLLLFVGSDTSTLPSPTLIHKKEGFGEKMDAMVTLQMKEKPWPASEEPAVVTVKLSVKKEYEYQ